ncbi:hypothetical protein [Qipengyuania atrilutea]|uniref:Uncharacterized protein n=1 Tax=Qipengyuania atrilutea TaxID=2744473 RepID=A0A850H0M4_9SPHN|nr:hypothetical protein [Actirhodobacter atriluteus]NVD43493.1 hypothetical protein [Actirhodobacter atriluteus]
MIRRAVALVAGHWQIAVGIAALLIATHLLAYCGGRSDGTNNVLAEQREAEIDRQRQTREADENADSTRTLDQQENTDNAQERTDAINDGGRIGLNCLRLRKHYREADLPAACRR